MYSSTLTVVIHECPTDSIMSASHESFVSFFAFISVILLESYSSFLLFQYLSTRYITYFRQMTTLLNNKTFIVPATFPLLTFQLISSYLLLQQLIQQLPESSTYHRRRLLLLLVPSHCPTTHQTRLNPWRIPMMTTLLFFSMILIRIHSKFVFIRMFQKSILRFP